jgi:hypothetical protein
MLYLLLVKRWALLVSLPLLAALLLTRHLLDREHLAALVAAAVAAPVLLASATHVATVTVLTSRLRNLLLHLSTKSRALGAQHQFLPVWLILLA